MKIADILQDIFEEDVFSFSDDKKISILEQIETIISHDNPGDADNLKKDVADLNNGKIKACEYFLNFCKSYSDIVSKEIEDSLRKKLIEIFSNSIAMDSVGDQKETDQKKLVRLIKKIINSEDAKKLFSEGSDEAIFYLQGLIHHIDDAYIGDKKKLKFLLHLEYNKIISDMTLESPTKSQFKSQPPSPIKEMSSESQLLSPRKNFSALGNYVDKLNKNGKKSVISYDEQEFLNKIILGSCQSNSEKIIEARLYYNNPLRISTKIIFSDKGEVKAPECEGVRKSGLFLRCHKDSEERITEKSLIKICVNNITNILNDLLQDKCYCKLKNEEFLSAILNLANDIGGFQSHSNDDLRKCFMIAKYGAKGLSDSEINYVRKFSMEFQKRAKEIKMLSPEGEKVGLRTKRIGDFIDRRYINILCKDAISNSRNLAKDDNFLNSITCELSQQQNSSNLSDDCNDHGSICSNSHDEEVHMFRVRSAVRCFDAEDVKKRISFDESSEGKGPSSAVRTNPRTDFSCRSSGVYK